MLRKSVLPSIPDRQSSQEDTVTSNFEAAVMRKVAWRLIPFLSIGYMINALDRFNVSMAALTMNQDLGLSASAYGFGAGAFFWTYILSLLSGQFANKFNWLFSISVSQL